MEDGIQTRRLKEPSTCRARTEKQTEFPMTFTGIIGLKKALEALEAEKSEEGGGNMKRKLGKIKV